MAIVAAIRCTAAGRRPGGLAGRRARPPRRGRRGDGRGHRRCPAGRVPTDGDRDAGGAGRGCRPAAAGLGPGGTTGSGRAGSGLGDAALRAGLLVASPVRAIPAGRSDARPVAAGAAVPMDTATLVRRRPGSREHRRARDADRGLAVGDRRVHRRAEAVLPVGECELLDQWSKVGRTRVTVMETSPWEGVVLDGAGECRLVGWDNDASSHQPVGSELSCWVLPTLVPASTCWCGGWCRRHGERGRPQLDRRRRRPGRRPPRTVPAGRRRHRSRHGRISATATSRTRKALDEAELQFVARVVADGGIGPWRAAADQRLRTAFATFARHGRLSASGHRESRRGAGGPADPGSLLAGGRVADRRGLAGVLAAPVPPGTAAVPGRAAVPARVERLALGDVRLARAAADDVLTQDPGHRAAAMLLALLWLGVEPGHLPSLTVRSVTPAGAS